MEIPYSKDSKFWYIENSYSKDSKNLIVKNKQLLNSKSQRLFVASIIKFVIIIFDIVSGWVEYFVRLFLISSMNLEKTSTTTLTP